MIGELFLSFDEYKDLTINFTDEENNIVTSFKLHSMILKHFSEYFKSNENFTTACYIEEKCINWGPEEQKYVSIEAFRIIIDHWYEIKKSYSSERKNVLNEILENACDYLQCDFIIPKYDLLFPYEIIIKSFQIEIKKSYSSERKNVLNEILENACDYLQCDFIIPKYDLLFPYEIIIKSFQDGDHGYLLYVDIDNNINRSYTKHVGKNALQKLADLAGIKIEELRIEQYKYITFKNRTYVVDSFSGCVTRLNEILEDYISFVYYNNFYSISHQSSV